MKITARMKRGLSLLLILMMIITMTPSGINAYADEGYDTNIEAVKIYVDASGSDTGGDGSEGNPYATLTKAAEIVNSSTEKDFIVYVMSDLTAFSLARFDSKNVTITGLNNQVTVSRADDFATASDNARSWYNPAMVEIQTSSGTANLTLENIIFDDAGKHKGTVFAQAISGEGNEEGNLKYVQDAIIASNATKDCTITLGKDAILRNFGGMSAVRITDQAQLVMANGSIIEDTTVTDRTKGKAQGEVGPAGAVWIQGSSFTMNAGAVIQNVIGRAVYADGGKATVDGTITNTKSDAQMWQNGSGSILHLRNSAIGCLASDCLVQGNSGTLFDVNNSELDMKEGSKVIDNTPKGNVIFSAQSTVTINSEIANNNTGGNHILQTNNNTTTTIGSSANIHDNSVLYGTIYLNGTNETLDIYGKINNNYSSNRGGGVVLANNGGKKDAVMYDGAEICGNYAEETGGGMMISVGTFTMNGGTISGNIAKGDGGGVYVRRGGQFIVNGGTIENNATTAMGGGIAFEAGNYSGYTPFVELNGGVISNNIMKANIATDEATGKKSAEGGKSNDLSIGSTDYGHINRYLYISDDMVIGNKGVYFKTNQKTVTPAENSLNLKLGNASGESITALTAEAQTKGWSKPLASYWLQRNGAAAMTVDGLTLDENSPKTVYALVQQTAEDGKPATDSEIKTYATQIDENGKINLTIPNCGDNGCAVALVQPTADYGNLLITGPKELKENKSAESYDVPYTTTYTMSENLKSLIEQDKDNLNNQNCSFVFTVELDPRLTAQADCKLESPIFDVASVTANGNTLTVTCTLKDDWQSQIDQIVKSPMILKGCGKLAATDFQVGEILHTTGNIQGQIINQNILVPANICQTKLVEQGNSGGGNNSYTLTLTKVDADDNSYTLQGAKFDLYRQGEKDDTKIGSYTTDKDGIIQAKVSQSGDYYWLETQSPAGYTLDTTKYATSTAASKRSIVVKNQKTETPSILNSDDHFAYVIGYPDGLIHPDGEITRAETATIFFRLINEDVRNENLTKDNGFSDVGKDNWFNTAVSTMSALNIVNGYPNGTFEPNAPITRAEFAAIAARFDSSEADTTADFTDIKGHWAAEEISKAAKNGWVGGYPDGTFKPNQNITRAEAMALINRVLNRNPETADDLLATMVVWPDNMDQSKWCYLDIQEATNSHDYERKANNTEYWTKITQNPDWSALEK